MRVILGWALAICLVASPAMAKANGSDDSAGPAGSDSASSAPAKSAPSAGNTAAKPAASSTESEIEELRDLMESQARQLQDQSEQLKLEQQKMEALEEQLKLANARGVITSAPAASSLSASAPSPAFPASASSSASAVPASAAAGSSSSTAPVPSPSPDPQVPDSPLQFHIGSAFFTPLGFMDFTGVGRTTNAGNGIGSNFGSIPYDFTSTAGAVNLVAHNTEARLSMQNSRFGIRVDALVKGAHVIGYTEWDFLGNNAASVAVTSNSNTLRSRLYWVDISKNQWEIMAGQSWSLITPGRTGISPLPGNIFYSQDMDVNYQAGLTWARLPEIRFVWHPNTKMAFAIALDQDEQYVGASGGAGTIVLPASPTVGGVSTAISNGQLDAASTTVSAPELFPDVIAKAAFDPNSHIHFEFGGVETQFKLAVNSTIATTSPFALRGQTGGGGFINSNVELFKGFHLIENYFYSVGDGRYIFGEVPDVVVNPNGSMTQIPAQSTVDGFEYTHKNTMVFAYYGGIYSGRVVGVSGGTQYGWGVLAQGALSPSYSTAVGQNRNIQEGTIGFNQTFWRDAKYGALNMIGQYSYMWRTPWSVGAGQPQSAVLNIFFLDLRYTLPGAAPAAGELR